MRIAIRMIQTLEPKLRHKCEICGSGYGVGRHHKFKQAKWARKLYGEIIDHPQNVQWACANCHSSHNSPKLIHWDEETFCKELNIKAISKAAKNAPKV